jgi:hypothetical protein
VQPSLPLPAGQLGRQGVEVLVPGAAEPLEPPVDVLQRRGLDRSVMAPQWRRAFGEPGTG